MWYYLAVILILIASLFLVLIVLVQNPKGGGLASGFSGANQFGGVAQTNKFLEKSTWTLAIVILVLSFVATISMPRPEKQEKTTDLTEIVNNINFNQAPTTPINNPQQNTNDNQ